MNLLSFLLKLIQTVCTAGALLLFAACLCLAAEQPIQISADKMTSVEDSQSVVFSGNVDARQGDVRIRSDKMTIYYEQQEKKQKTGSKNSQQVKEIICTGKVEVTSKEWLGTSDTMHYSSKNRLVQLIGNAKAYKGQNMVQGGQIDYYLDTGKSEVFNPVTGTSENGEGEKKPGRVNMTIMEE